jgi:hypothetical protein
MVLKKTLMAVHRGQATCLEKMTIHTVKFNSVWMPLKTCRSASKLETNSLRFGSGESCANDCGQSLISSDLFVHFRKIWIFT